MLDWIIYVYIVLFFFGIYFLILFLLLYAKNRKELYSFPKPTRFPMVSIITPAYNEESAIESTIKNLLALDYPKDKKEIIVVNDGSTDSTAEIVQRLMKFHNEIKLINKKNSGKADSLNRGIAMAKGEFIIVVDADSFPAKDCIKKTIGYFEQDEKIAAVTTKVLAKNNKNFMERYQVFDYVVIAWSRKIMDFIDSVYVTNGPFSVYRKDLIQKVGGFDKKNMTEDIELTWNLLSKGYKTKMSYSATVYTIVPNTLMGWIRQRIRWNLGGWQTLYKYRKHFLKGENSFGYFVVNYVALSFILALVGFFLSLRWIALKLLFYLREVPFIFQGYNPFKYAEFSFIVSFLLLFGLIFLCLALFYYKFSIRNENIKSKSILTILIYTFIYRPIYIAPLVASIFKLIKGDIRWFTK
jgi:cellulose synthase/poly-beta-1,6-N-acetylglucosamine synthase-like glycosyltransferase